jgi:hypothetical protein
VDPALGADVGAGEEFFQVGRVIAVFSEFGEDFIRRL